MRNVQLKGSRILAERHNSRWKIPPVLRIGLLVTGALRLGGLLLLSVIPTFDGPHSRQHANEAATVGRLRTLVALQNQHLAAHPSERFVCELSLLKPREPREKADYDPLGFLTTGTQSGYKFSLANCGSDTTRANAHYYVTAIPVEHGITGFWAFCADESGVIWYDKAGSATHCLGSRHALE